MLQTPFHAYYKARLLEQLPEEEQFLPVFASSDIEIYPFQIAAASFALRSPYQNNVINLSRIKCAFCFDKILQSYVSSYEVTNVLLGSDRLPS